MLTGLEKTRAAWVIMGFLMVATALWGRLLWLQVLQPHHWVTIARRQHLQMLQLQPTRGNILDRQGRPFAVSIRLTSVFANPRRLKNPLQAAQRLAPILGQSVEEIRNKLSRKDRGFVWLARRISNQAAAQIRGLKISGIDFVMEPQRVYPQGYLASHVLGFAGMDAEGLEGLELVYNSVLKGEPGWRWLALDARRRAVGAWDAPFVAPRDGLELVLTLDTTIQFIVERELERVYSDTHAESASVVVMDPRTGEILALANRPTFDPNRYSETPQDARRNRAVTDTFEPGSVFKVVTAAVALGTGAIRPTDTIYCEGGEFPVAGHVLHDVHPYQWLTFREVITHSSNIGTTKVAMRLGPQPIFHGMQAFGFGVLTGVELPGEVRGTVKPPQQWSKPSITAIPIGQEVTVTAIQLAQAISAIANGGTLLKPWIVREIRHPSGTVVKSFKPVVIRRVIGEEADRSLREILAGVVAEGTGKLAAVPGFRAAGKTGTAQKIDPAGGYSHSDFIASFIGFVPVEEPRLAIVVTVNNPRPYYYGGVVAAPVFSRIATDSLAYLGQTSLQTAMRNDES